MNHQRIGLSNKWRLVGFLVFSAACCSIVALTIYHSRNRWHQTKNQRRSLISSKHALHFSYDPKSPVGPSHWHEVDIRGNEWEKYIQSHETGSNLDRTLVNQCGDGRKESPIHLKENTDCMDGHQILTKEPHENDCTIHDLKFRITPNSLRATFPTNPNQCTKPTVDLPNGFAFLWEAIWIEIKIRSEHMMDGQRYDGELVMAHLGQHEDNREVAFISVLLEASAYVDDPKMAAYIAKWEQVAYATALKCNQLQEEEKQRFDGGGMRQEYPRDAHESFVMPSGETLRPKMFPYDLWPTIYYYRYRGSLTEPPCTSMVNWRVFDEPLKISRRQFKALARLINEYVDPRTCRKATVASATGETHRPIQEANEEEEVMKVAHCTAAHYAGQGNTYLELEDYEY